MSLEDKDYVEHVLAGEVAFFERLVAKYNRMAGAIAYGIVGDFQHAEDIVQEAFLKAYRALADLRDPTRFKAWLAGIVRSKALDFLRAQRREVPLDATDTGEAVDATSIEETHVREESRRKVLDAVECLPYEDRLVLVLKHMEGLSYKEVAQLTGSTVSAVESRLFRARKALRRRLGPRQARGMEQ